MNSNNVGVELGSCDVCGWGTSKPSHTSNAISLMYISVPESAEPREGVKILSENAEISISDAADVLDSKTETTLKEVQNATD